MDEPRLARLIEEQFGFVWRLLRRTGVSEDGASAATRQVFGAAAGRIGDIRAGSERAFLFSTVLHVGARARRGSSNSAEFSSRATPDVATLDALLDEMPLELRVVLVLYEIEQLHCAELSEVIGVPLTTVASRLRQAREDFGTRVARLEGAEVEPSPTVLDEPPRLIEHGSGLTRALLRAAREESPDLTVMREELAAIGKRGVADSSASVPQSASAQVGARTASAAPAAFERNASIRGSSGALVVKWLLVGAAIGLVLSSAVYAFKGAFMGAEPGSGTQGR